MKASLQNQIKPHAPPISQEAKKAQDAQKTERSDIDFLSLMNNSNAAVKEERQAANNLDNAKDYEEFLEKLNKQRSTSRKAPKNELSKDDFLKLFTTQLQNQDPLNPEDSSETASRMAHFNSLEQMLNVNKTLEKMHGLQTQQNGLDFVNYIGKEVEVPQGRFRLGSGESKLTFDLGASVNEAEINIIDAAGKSVYARKIGSLKQGEQSFTWDGKTSGGEPLPIGDYQYQVKAKGMQGEEIPVTLKSKLKITGVDFGAEKDKIITDAGKIGIGDIQKIEQPKES